MATTSATLAVQLELLELRVDVAWSTLHRFDSEDSWNHYCSMARLCDTLKEDQVDMEAMLLAYKREPGKTFSQAEQYTELMLIDASPTQIEEIQRVLDAMQDIISAQKTTRILTVPAAQRPAQDEILRWVLKAQPEEGCASFQATVALTAMLPRNTQASSSLAPSSVSGGLSARRGLREWHKVEVEDKEAKSASIIRQDVSDSRSTSLAAEIGASESSNVAEDFGFFFSYQKAERRSKRRPFSDPYPVHTLLDFPSPGESIRSGIAMDDTKNAHRGNPTKAGFPKRRAVSCTMQPNEPDPWSNWLFPISLFGSRGKSILERQSCTNSSKRKIERISESIISPARVVIQAQDTPAMPHLYNTYINAV